MSFKYSYNTIVYSGEDYLTQVKRLNKFGYDGIELVGEPSWYNFNEVNKLNEEYNIKVINLNLGFPTIESTFCVSASVRPELSTITSNSLLTRVAKTFLSDLSPLICSTPEGIGLSPLVKRVNS